MKTLVFLLEEPSAQDLLQGFIPKLVPHDTSIHYLIFDGKQDLEKQLVRKISKWVIPHSAFVVLRDQDAGRYLDVKNRLVERVAKTGRSPVLVRVACRELEAWVLGDWPAVSRAFERPELAKQGGKKIYRQPDGLAHPVAELRKFIPEYQKRDGARRVGRFLDPDSNQSLSFRAFCAGVRKLFA